MSGKPRETSQVNGDDYIRRRRKEVAKRQLERAAERGKKTAASKPEAELKRENT